MKKNMHVEKCEMNEYLEKKYVSCDCDGYHTFDELYDHRIILFMELCKQIHNQPYNNDDKYGVWKSKRHSDGEVCFGTGTQFVMGIGQADGKQITYHIPIDKWDECYFAVDVVVAPEFDGHTSDDVLERLAEL